MKLILPLDGIGTAPGIYTSQNFGDVWIADHDMVLTGISIKKGQNVYKVAFGMDGHNGWDIAAPRGTPVKASHDGKLEHYGDSTGGYGLNARIYFNEDGVTYDLIYGHFLKYEGDARDVKAGEIIGYVDSTGFSEGDHLHFGIRKLLNGSVMDYNNGYFGYFDPRPFCIGANMQLIRDNGTVYLVAGVTTKVKTGIASQEALAALFGDEPIVDGDTSATPESQTLADGFLIHKK